jgi:chromosome partitioning protein
MHRIVVCNHKGGTGKTTTALHLAAALGLSGHRTLAIDLDPQGFLSRMMGIKNPPEERSSLALFDGEDRSLSDIKMHRVEGFDLLPSSKRLTKMIRSLNKPTDVLWTKEALDEGIDYDVVLFDTAAAITVYSLNALVAARHVVVPVTPEYQPVVGAEQTFRTVRMVQDQLNPDLTEPRFLLTQVDARKRTHDMYRQYLRDEYDDLVMDGVIRTSSALAESYEDGSTVFKRNPQSRGARDYANAADEVLRRLKGAPSSNDEAAREVTSSPPRFSPS